MMVSPRRVRWFCSPGRTFSDNDARSEFIVAKHAVPLRGLAQDQDQVRQVGDDLAVLVENELDRSNPGGLPRLSVASRAFFEIGEAVLED